MPKKKTHEEFVNEVKLATNGDYIVLGSYVSNMKNVLMKHKIRDKIKDEYCKNNKIKLIRIPYWDFEKIDFILDELFD